MSAEKTRISQGSYSDILRDTKSGKIIKKEPFTYDGQFLYCSTISEVILLRCISEAVIPYVSHIQNVELYQEKEEYIMEVYMEDGGIPLHRVKRDIRHRYAPEIILSLTEALLHLERLGIQHTDIKPNNILFNPSTKQTTLIDFNCASIRTLNCHDAMWNQALGTWSYVPPEIVEKQQPYDTSPVWSIAYVLIYLYTGHHPFSTWKSVTMKEMESRKYWKKLYQELRNSYTQGVPSHHLKIPDDYRTIFDWCTRWNPHDRPTLQTLYDHMYRLVNHMPSPRLGVLHYQHIYTPKNLEQREIDCRELWNWVKEHDTIRSASRILGIYDLMPTPNLRIALALGQIMEGIFIDINEYPIQNIMDTLHVLDWHIHDIPADVLLHQNTLQLHDESTIIETIFQIQSSYTESYTMEILSHKGFTKMIDEGTHWSFIGNDGSNNSRSKELTSVSL